MRISDWSSDVCSSDLAGLAPQLQGRRLAVADVEPQEEPAGRLAEAEAVAEDALGQREVAAVVVAVRCHVRLVAPQAGAGGENRPRPAGTPDPPREVGAVEQRRGAGTQAPAPDR